MEFTSEQIKNKHESLPEDVKKAVSSLDTTDALIDIGERYKLHVDKIGELLDETTLVMLGLKPTSNFVDSIKKRLGTSSDLAEKIVKDVNEQILVKIRESLRKMHEEPEEKILPLDNPEKKEGGEKEVVEKQNIIEPKSGKKLKEEEKLLKEDLLKEIEDPIDKETEDNSVESNQDSVADDLSLNVQKKPMITSDIVENKLTQIVKEPVQEEEVQEEVKKEEEKSVDPYREPIE